MTHFTTNLKTVSVNLGPGFRSREEDVGGSTRQSWKVTSGLYTMIHWGD